MADENININVNSNVGDVAKDANNAAAEFKVMGVSLNGIKKGFASAAVTAKGMFGSLKAGLISSGIGAFLVIIGSLIAYFKSTKRGAEMLERAMAGIGAVVSVITDLLSSFGEVIVNAFSNPKKAIADLWQAIKTNIVNRVEGLFDVFGALGDTIKAAFSLDWEGVKAGAADFSESMIQTATGVDDLTGKMAKGFTELATEIEKDVTAAMKLKGLTQELRDEEREFSKVRAQTRQDIQKARLDALDETKTAEERLAAVQKANELELKTTEDVLEMQKRKIQIQKETMALSENMAEDLDELAALEVGLIDLQTQSFQTQKRLATEMETLQNEIRANEKERAQEKLDEIKAEQKAAEELFDAQMAQAKAFEERVKKAAEKEKEIAKQVKDAKVGIAKDGLALVSAVAGEGSELAKGAAVAQATISGIEGVQNAYTTAQKSPLTALFPGYPIVQAGLAAAFSAVQIQKILSTSTSGGGAGGGSVGGAGGGGTGAATPAPQMMSGAFDLTGGEAPEAVKAFVVTDEMTNSQNQLANIRRRATI